MDRLFALLALVAAIAACKESADRKSSPPSPPPTLDELQAMVPETLAGLPRRLVTPTPEIQQVSAYYQDQGNTRSGHVNYTILTDVAKTVKYYEGRFRERASVSGHTAYTRQYQPKTAPETAEGCLVVGRVGVCIDLAPATIGDLAPLFHQLPLADLEKRPHR
jgi:hypothetical protein